MPSQNPPLLTIRDLRVSIADREVVSGLSLTVNPGEVHAIMGPNGSGKSTLVNALMGHPAYTVTSGSVTFKGEDLLSKEPHERSLSGLFLAFQYPKEIAGVTLRSFLFAAHKAKRAHEGAKHLSPIQFQKKLLADMQELKMDPSFAERFLNRGFSGGEKKKAEILQLRVLEPVLALLDETDSGLDVDALRIVAEGVNAQRSAEFSCVVVTHYARILEYIKADHVHVMAGGKILQSGGPEFAKTLEREGYAKYGGSEKSASIGLELS
jgi:Fe-S cluster assembly ATP-binding protein